VTHVLHRPAPSPDAVVRYADHPDGLLDVYLPAESTDPAAVIVLVHGGFWRAEYDRVHIRPLADALRRQGLVVAVPEYRRTGAAPDRVGGWPRTAEDLRSVVTRLPELLGRIGVRNIGPTSLVGHSAGGHLVLWLASETLPVGRVVALAPVGDLRDADERDLDGGAVRALLGGGPEELPEVFLEADPALRLATAPGPAVVVLHGTADVQVPLANSDWAIGRDHVDLVHLQGADHFDLIDPESEAWPAVLGALGLEPRG
jgi:acetyl esterase/lipase